MNAVCWGEYYKYCGKIFYRCLFDGTTINVKKIKTYMCPNCNRTIDVPPYNKDMRETQSQIQVVTTTTIMVKNKDGNWIQHRKEIKGSILNN